MRHYCIYIEYNINNLIRLSYIFHRNTLDNSYSKTYNHNPEQQQFLTKNICWQNYLIIKNTTKTLLTTLSEISLILFSYVVHMKKVFTFNPGAIIDIAS